MKTLTVHNHFEHAAKPTAVISPARSIGGVFAGIPAQGPTIAGTNHNKLHIIDFIINAKKGGGA